MAAKGGISGLGMAVATLGGLLVYAGFKGTNPLEALRDVASGTPSGVSPRNAGLQAAAASYRSGGDAGGASGPGAGNALVDAARSYSGDKYSQARRNSPGFSDCSSFVGKALRKIGIDPPKGSTTGSYLASPRFKKVSRAQARAGDLAVTTAHMAIFTGPDTAIGQQNSRRNVVEGTVEDVMYPSRAFTVLRYDGPLPGSASVPPPRSAWA